MAVFRLARTILAICHGTRRQGAVLVLAAGIAACSPVFRNHGYVPAEDELAQIEIGSDTRETVGQKIGRPSTSGLLNDEGWYYVQSRYEHLGPRAPKEIERQLLAITFNQAGVVENIGRYGLEDGKVVEISRRVTETNIKGLSLIQQLLGNFGRLQAGDLLGE
ncbi:outer membrane protein assembly factor BamE [Tabrizicola sp.]|uniref:outer membrane protein assembly factor BamE n=1 Tax=Tabrizicola sp. TaxID=2005166 RepID=UPI0026204E52|nr:outer membrane protein assembly factor BamE [Tabrizicola sp.]MDM7931070.1 outer membrane protein assembly factor BamE [Tabrizicola sp.]